MSVQWSTMFLKRWNFYTTETRSKIIVRLINLSLWIIRPCIYSIIFVKYYRSVTIVTFVIIVFPNYSSSNYGCLPRDNSIYFHRYFFSAGSTELSWKRVHSIWRCSEVASCEVVGVIFVVEDVRKYDNMTNDIWDVPYKNAAFFSEK